ncbi:MAG: PBP1A family penicillin-binding protein [Alicyclobacillus macrosporangiidus]|uniref:transglycosylase domain-containing protein n=1 Tax=Alicyclobacillus macrosporangiidus TaxID=392015 RepID=UPI0026E95854|nr:PBP1A family penicillin-binding protein [Alicyclobacillus macrosporangiidus]MCL6597751.1 PBP1A family penicillin-binding protein [Alicyclobacillus macrosporangiidus]
MTFEQTPAGRAQAGGGAAHWWQRTPWWTKYLAIPLVSGFAGMTALLLILRTAPLPDQSFVHPTHIDAADGSRLAEWTTKGARAGHVPLQDIPAALQEATIAVEDQKFYQHHAFNPRSLLRATWVDLRHGGIVQGGSTITQQLAKNLFLTQDRTLGRKLREALYALQLELHESKSAILEQYLNTVYYGEGAYGVAAASEVYFNKPVQDLSVAECAMLAGLPKGPGLYSPITHPEAAKRRQREVLDRMVQAGFLTREEADAAAQEHLSIAPVQRRPLAAPYFTAAAVREVERRFHLSPEDLDQGGIQVTTTLDPVLQQAAERAIASTLPRDSGIQAALVALDPQTGAIRAMVGGRDFAQSPYNRAFAERQPGSTFKAVLYTAALEHGWTPDRQIASEMTTFLYDQDKTYTVRDYGDIYAHRPLTLREALARSDNVYAVTANLELGPETVIETARKMGISTPMQPYPSLALGVFPVSPLEMAAAYAALANGGFAVTPYTVEAVHDGRQGRDFTTAPSRRRAVPEAVAFQMTDLMRSVLEPGGTGYSVHHYLHGTAAAKTGTTNTDAWMIGYTPRLVCAVWVGYDDNRPLGLAESHLAAPIWAKFMGTAQQRLPGPWFSAPAGLVRRTIDPVTAKLATSACSTTETDYFVPGTEPSAFCPLHTPAPDRPGATWSQWWRRWWPNSR